MSPKYRKQIQGNLPARKKNDPIAGVKRLRFGPGVNQGVDVSTGNPACCQAAKPPSRAWILVYP
jgi:hypothetical protein